MKFNTTYISTISLKNTIKELAFIKDELIQFLKTEYNLINISIPLFLGENDEKLIDLQSISRDLTVDFAYENKLGRFLFSPTNYMRNLINKLKLDFEEGIIGEGKFIFRDILQSPVTSIVKDEIVAQIKYPNFNSAEQAVKDFLFKFYDKIYLLAQKMHQKYNVSNLIEKKPYFVSAQALEIENPNQNFKEREISFSLEKHAFWLVAPGKVLYSGHIHTSLPLSLYDIKNFYQLVLHDRVNSGVIKPVQIGILANGVQLSDQLKLYNQPKYQAYRFYKKLMSEEFKVIEIRINIPRIAMAILGKGHLFEVQPGVISEEAKTIIQKFNVENY